MALRFGPVVVSLLALTGLADLALRFMPIDPLTFRAWEAVSRYRAPDAAFERNRRYRNARAFGDLAALGNLPQHREYRAETFTTDDLGFRNVPAKEDGGPVVGLLVGDSFAAGGGVADEHTLPAQLSGRVGCRVYNAAGLDYYTPERLLALARAVGMRGGTVIYVYLEPGWIPPAVHGSTPSALPQWLRARLRGLIEVSPLRILATRALRTMENDWILPNSHASRVVHEPLRNGDVMLFLPDSLTTSYEKLRPPIEYFTRLTAELERMHLDLLVVLVPNKYTVYGPWSVRPTSVPEQGWEFLDRFESSLHKRGFRVLNLAPLFADEARAGFSSASYIYWKDDTHWNAQGMLLAAAAIEQAWVTRPPACR